LTDSRKLAVVTGANRGMGFETCRQLGRLGYRVVLTARDFTAGKDAANKLKSEGLEVEPFQLDLTRPEEIARLVMIARRDWGQVHTLVNNAGIYLERNATAIGKNISVFDSRMEVIRTILESNALGPLSLSQGIISMMRENNYGRVVNLSSGMGQLSEMYGGAPGFRLACVCTNAITRIFAHELKGTNVLVNSVDPGWVRTHTKEATRSIEEGVETTIWLATLPDGGPSGQFFRDKQPIAW